MTERHWNSLEEEFTCYAIIQQCINLVQERLEKAQNTDMSDLITFAQEILKTADQKAVNVVVDLFLAGFFGQDVRQLGVKAREKVKETLVDLYYVYTFLKQEGITPKEIPAKISSDLINGILKEEDSNLREKWINLLKSAWSGNEIDPIYISVMDQLTPTRAKILDVMYEFNINQRKLTLKDIRHRFQEKYLENINNNIIANNLARLEGLNLCKGIVSFENPENILEFENLPEEWIDLTNLGVEFMKAVTTFERNME